MDEIERLIYDEIENIQNVCSSWELGDITSHTVADRLEKAAAALRALPCDEIVEQSKTDRP